MRFYRSFCNLAENIFNLFNSYQSIFFIYYFSQLVIINKIIFCYRAKIKYIDDFEELQQNILFKIYSEIEAELHILKTIL